MHEKTLPSKPPATHPQVEVAGSPVRCPYCHTDCQPEEESAIVCQRCLSRHHAGCWSEGGACSSCGSTKALRSATPEITVAPAELELLKRGLPREAVVRVTQRLSVSEAEATRALLDAASRALQNVDTRFLPPSAIVAIVAIVMIFSIPLLGILTDIFR